MRTRIKGVSLRAYKKIVCVYMRDRKRERERTVTNEICVKERVEKEDMQTEKSVRIRSVLKSKGVQYFPLDS